MAHIAGYLHASAAAAAGSGATPASAAADPDAPLFLCEGRATSAARASARVSALAAALTQRLGMQVGRPRWLGHARSGVWVECMPGRRLSVGSP